MAVFNVVDQDGDTAEIEIDLSQGTLTVVTGVRLQGDTLILYDFHVDGPGAGEVGWPTLRQLVRRAMEEYGVEILEIHGFPRTTGARPGRRSPPLRFRRC